MVYSFNYRRPRLVESSAASTISFEEKTRSIHESVNSGTSGSSRGIPDALSFDRIISGGTCPPCTTRDFMNYLIHIELSAENLQFYLWYRDYCKRFDELPSSERVLAPEWTPAQAEAAIQAAQVAVTAQKKVSPETAEMFKDTDFAGGPRVHVTETSNNPFSTPPRTPAAEREEDGHDWHSVSNDGASTLQGSHQQSIASKAAGAFQNADLKWQPFTVQPFREEVARVITTYIAEGSPRELNLSSRERVAVLHALKNTTHPSAFRTIAATVEWSLRFQAHPNFIRWAICNGNRPRVIFARGLGVGGILLGTVAAILITLSDVGRGYRALAAIGWAIGIATLIAAWKGMCVVLHGMHHRHLRPWELFAEDEDAGSDYELKKASFDSLGSSNSYEDQPWVAKYERRNIIRKVFDREVWIQEPALRSIQDTIFIQAIVGAVVISAVCTAVFVALPHGGYY
ncbi:MAG: 60S ribosomal protein L24 [Chaenotheca gracillima]|nr:MAG: 60S ribosomal protein L24 [Chaenotheca gracillima]